MWTRRRLLAATAAGGFGSMLVSRVMAQASAWAERAAAANEKELVIAGGTGAYGELVKKYFFDPFTEATGIKVTNAGGSYGEKLAKLKAMSTAGRIEWDMISMSIDSLVPDTVALLQDLGGCADLPLVAQNGIPGACVGRGVMFDIGGGVLAYDRESFPNAQPKGWADFWDVAKFPGPRALPNIGTPWWPMIAALVADGVPPDQIFPLDEDRAFKKLDEIKPHVTVWWKSGDQSQQIFRSKEVVMGMLFAGRAGRLKAEGLPIEVIWQGAPLDASVWAVVKGTPHPNAAMALLEFVYTRPEAHAQFAAESFGATALKDAVALMPEAARASQATAPDNWSGIIRVDPAWLASRQESVLKRWAEWIAV